MAFTHGIYAHEVPTAILPPSCLADGIPVFIGTAPIQQAVGGLENANKAIYCSSKAEAVAQLGYSDDWGKYTLCEAMYAAFDLYRIAPIIFINVLDPSEHKEKKTTTITLSAGTAELPEGTIKETLEVKDETKSKTYELNTDYLTNYADDGTLRLVIIPTGSIAEDGKLSVSCDVLNPELVTKADIIGGIDLNDGKKKGTEVISEVYMHYNKIPGSIGAPGWADDSEVGAILTAKGYGINGIFTAQMIALDISAKTCKKYSDVPAKKKELNFYDPLQTVCWPMAKLGERKFHGSTLAMLRKALTDFDTEGVPYKSPSNKDLKTDGAILADGTVIWLDLTSANYLGENGICTFLNIIGGWKLWGDRTAAYPGNTDPKDTFICTRAMMSWWGNREVLTYWQKIDEPLDERLLTTIINSMKIDINGLTGSALLGGDIVLLKAENPTTRLIDGKIAFHTYLGFKTPAETIDFYNEYDTTYIQELVSSLAKS